MFLGVVVVQIWWTKSYDLPGGHASGHFLNATAIFGVGFATAVVIWAVPARERRQPALWCLALLIVGAALAVTIGNLWVVDAIGDHNWTNEQADALGSGL